MQILAYDFPASLHNVLQVIMVFVHEKMQKVKNRAVLLTVINSGGSPQERNLILTLQMKSAWHGF